MDDVASHSQSADAAASANHGAAAEEDDEGEEFCDVEAWETLSKSFREVQSLLDLNRRLIQQVNDNHRSRIPSNLAKNVGLICEINSNMAKVVRLYSNLSANLSGIVKRRRAQAGKAAKKVE